MYQLEQKTIWWSALGLSIAGCLIFFAGMVVGLTLGDPPRLAEGTPPPALEAPVGAQAPTAVPVVTPPLDLSISSPPVLQVKPRDSEPEPAVAEPALADAVLANAVSADAVLADARAEAVVAKAEEPAADLEDPVLAPYSLQVGAYLMQENLDRALADLEKKGLEARVVEITDSRGTVLSSVRVGEYGDRSEAEDAATQLRRKKGLEVLVKRDLQQG